MGKYVNNNGLIFTGEFMAGLKHGCGEVINIWLYLRRVQLGMNPKEAWNISVRHIKSSSLRGTWLNDYFSEGEDFSYSGIHCTHAELQGVIEEAEEVSVVARLYRFKPEGFTQLFYQDGKGMPVRTLQDPLCYPYGSLFLCPGPCSQLCSLPEDLSFLEEISRCHHC
jgi:hypothetical protein